MRDLYRNFATEKWLYEKAASPAARNCGRKTSPAIQKRIDMEISSLFYSNCGTMFAAAAQLADFAADNGYPIGFRGTLGNLLLTRRAGISAVNPMMLGLNWKSAMDHPDGGMQGITLNVPEHMLMDFAEQLEALLPDCKLIRVTSNDTSSIRLAVTPGLPGDENRLDDFFTFTLCPSRLMAMNGGLQSRDVPTLNAVADPDFLGRMSFPVIAALLELEGLDELLGKMKPVTFCEWVKVMGLHLAPELSFQQAENIPLSCVVGTREDLYDFLRANGASKADAFAIMQQAGRGGFKQLTRASKAVLTKLGLLHSPILHNIRYLYPRAQLADYLYWALALRWYNEQRP